MILSEIVVKEILLWFQVKSLELQKPGMSGNSKLSNEVKYVLLKRSQKVLLNVNVLTNFNFFNGIPCITLSRYWSKTSMCCLFHHHLNQLFAQLFLRKIAFAQTIILREIGIIANHLYFFFLGKFKWIFIKNDHFSA